MKKLLLAGLITALASTAQAQVRITEFIYQGWPTNPVGGLGDEHEFVELTNVGASAIDMTGWYYRDSTEIPEIPFSLSGFGSIAAGETVIFADVSESDFRLIWPGMAPEVRVLGGAIPGLGNGDSIRIYDSSDTLVDRLDYTSNPRWRRITGVTSPGNLGENDISGWFFSDNAAGWFNDVAVNNLTSVNGDIGNPGYVNFDLAAVPEPSTVGLMLLVAVGAGGMMIYRRRNRNANA